MNNEQEKFIKRLIELMEEYNMTQIELANKINITNVTVSRYLSGERKPRIEIVTKIANFFNVTVDYLLGNSDDRNMKSSDSEINIGLSAKEYNTLTEVQKQQIRDFAEFVKNQNKK